MRVYQVMHGNRPGFKIVNSKYKIIIKQEAAYILIHGRQGRFYSAEICGAAGNRTPVQIRKPDYFLHA